MLNVANVLTAKWHIWCSSLSSRWCSKFEQW